MKKLVVVLLVLAALFLAVSCSDDPSARSSAAGKVGYAAAKYAAKQPEMKPNIDAFAGFVYEIIYDKDIDADKVDGIATAAVGVIEAMARQPEIKGQLVETFAATYKKIVGETMPKFTFPKTTA